MAVKKPISDDDSYQSRRMKLTYRLSARERRAMLNKIMELDEAIETATEARNVAILECWRKGLSFANISGALGVHLTTVKELISNLDPGRAEKDQDSGS